ncbi:MAG TPA: cation-translocating P-type ATPase [Bacilli bacterium]|nr:cation-translocating P-type ATPase [Bacilli bacterium]
MKRKNKQPLDEYAHLRIKNAHTETREETLNRLLVTPEGLSNDEVKHRQTDYGFNKLPEQKGMTLWKSLLNQMNNAMIYVLLIAAVISFVLTIIDGQGNYFEPILILAIVVLNAIIGTIQELRADKALAALEKLSAPTTIVRREGELQEIPASELVPGDIVILEDGRQVPADLRLLKSYNLKLSEASLTGESVPVMKDAAKVFDLDTVLGDRENIVYMTTPVVYGRGEGVVINTGTNTEVGKIAQSLANVKRETTPLQKRLEDLSIFLGYITLGLVALLFIIGLIREPSWANVKDMFLLAISLAVAAVPEGLAAVLTITLALGVQKMVRVHTIVRRLPSVETLGAVSVICSDKTGTLTKNEMRVTDSFLFDKSLKDTLAVGLALCNDATVDHGVYGDPTEIALILNLTSINTTKDELEAKFPRVNEIPFDSKRKMMSTLHQTEKGYIQYTKGALDVILNLTTTVTVDGKTRKITASDKNKINTAAKKMTNRALRVIALAKRVPSAEFAEEQNLTFIGFVGLFDPPREEAKASVEILKNAGVITMMITGDHQDTAYAVASELGIAVTPDSVISGRELDELTKEALGDALESKRVFARVSPENKVQIVEALKSKGHIVAMTGDGINDAPSLQRADIGIAMGITGTDVAKGASDMVLSDDNFSSIEKAVAEGRGIYKNVQKTVWFLLSSNIGEVLTMLVASIVGFPYPLTALHILWVNLITDSLPALALGSDVKDDDVMRDAPRPKDESLFAGGGYKLLSFYGVLIALMTILAFLYLPLSNGHFTLSAINDYFSDKTLLTRAQTYAFTTLGVTQLFHMFGMSNINKSALRAFSKKKLFMWIAFFFGFVLQVLVTEIPLLTAMFGTSELELKEWIFLSLFSMLPLVVHELKILIRFTKQKLSK